MSVTRNYCLFMLATVHSIVSMAQMLPSWQKFYSKDGPAQFYGMTVNREGQLVLAGGITPKGSNVQNLYFLITDQSGAVKMENTRTGGHLEEFGTAIVQTFDGGYAIAGKRNQMLGKKEHTLTWLIKLDQEAKTLWEVTEGVTGVSNPDIAQDNAGNLWLTGTINGQAGLFKYTATGDCILEKYFPGGSYPSVLCLQDQAIAIAYSSHTDPDTLQVVKMDLNGNFLWKMAFPRIRGADLIENDNWDLSVAGIITRETRNNIDNSVDMILLRLNAGDGAILDTLIAGGKDQDFVKAISDLPGGGLCLAGCSFSQKPSTRMSDAVLVVLSPDSNKRDLIFAGHRKTDIFNALALLPDGSLAAAGSTNSRRSDDAAWLVHFKGHTQPGPPARIRLDSVRLEDPDQNGKVDPGERAWLALYLHNEGPGEALSLEAQLSRTGGVHGLVYAPYLLAGRIPAGKNRKLSFPLFGADSMERGPGIYRIVFPPQSGEVPEPVEVTIENREIPRPHLELTETRFARTNDGFQLTLRLYNSGELPARGILPVFATSADGFRESTSGEIQILGAGDSLEIMLPCPLSPDFSDTTLQIRCRLTEASKRYGVSFEFNHHWKRPDTFLSIAWADPVPPDGIIRMQPLDTAAIIEVVIQSSHPIGINALKLRMKETGAKSVVSSIWRCPSDTAASKDIFSARCRCKVNLDWPLNKMQVQVSNGAGEKYTPERTWLKPPRLYVLAIGVPGIGLEYADADAADFCRAFSSQWGKLFEEIHILLLNTEDATDAHNIRTTINKWSDSLRVGKIGPQDYLFLFVSSHGLIDSRGFEIQGSHYNPQEGLSSVNFEKDILNRLDVLPCHKVLFVDACHSGTLVGAKTESLNEQIQRLVLSRSRICIMTSSSGDQLSFENKDWKNGAFTQAILEALEYESIPGERMESADTDGDHFLTLAEIFHYVKRRVKELLKTVNKPEQTPQLGIITIDGNKENGDLLPIFVLH